jgi:PIN domain nuclease of toxin-antitoxin system
VLLLDTCAFVWLAAEPRRLGARARRAIDDADRLLVSDVSVLEVCLKWQAKKLELPDPPRVWLPRQERAWQTQRVALEPDDCFRTTELPSLHRDPFDRLLIAQALRLGLTIVTPDKAIARYPVATLW